MLSMVDFEVKDVQVDIKPSSWSKIFKSQDMQNELKRRCDAIAQAANDASTQDSMDASPFGSDVKVGKHTALGIVFTNTPHGYNAKERMLDAIGAGGD